MDAGALHESLFNSAAQGLFLSFKKCGPTRSGPADLTIYKLLLNQYFGSVNAFFAAYLDYVNIVSVKFHGGISVDLNALH